MEKPLLSICIPTFNRAEYLKNCIDAIAGQEGFDEIEVVISDNYSTDGKQDIGEKYARDYPNIHYFRNAENVIDMNYPLVFQRAKGVLRKLTNDTVLYKPGAIKYMLNAVKENMDSRPQLYFLNKEDNGAEPRYYNTLENYIGNIGYLLTWIGSVALWEEDVDDLDTFINNTDSRLAQVPFLLEQFEKHGGSVVYPKSIMGGVLPKNKNLTYGLYQVFYVNFLGFIRPYAEQGKISNECYEKVRKVLLLDFFCRWIVNWEKDRRKYRFSETENLKELIENEYKNEPYFKEYKFRLIKLRLKTDIRKIVRRV